MRITSGERKGFKLATFDDKHIRPTSDKIRGAIFSSIFAKLGSVDTFVDVFSGTGAIGIEAKSNGIENVYLFDNNKRSINLIRKNLKITSYQHDIHLFYLSALEGLKSLKDKNIKADVYFMDPPYKKLRLIYPLLEYIKKHHLLAKDGLIIIEHDKKDKLENEIDDFTCYKTKDYGGTTLSFYEQESYYTWDI